MSRSPLRLAAVVALVIAPLGLMVSARADSDFVQVSGDQGPIRLMPGSGAAPEFDVHNESGGPASLHVQVIDVSEDDNGCVLPEQQAGDLTCGDGGGELGTWLELRVQRVDDAGERELWVGSLAQLEHGTDLLDRVAAGDSPRLRVSIALPRTATNVTMSDRVTFGLRWTYTGAPATGTTVAGPSVAGTTTVLGVEQDAGGGAGAHSGYLAETGSPVSPRLLAVAAALLGVGGLATARGRRRSRRPIPAR
jgi:hypothetical protein